jgi:uncharacterized protein (TIGR03437 family)
MRFWCVLLLTASLEAANYAFMFHGSQPTVSIYDADTMQLVGAPTIGVGGARRAFGVPDPSNPTQFLKFYVITGNSIVVLNAQSPFLVRATLSLAGSVPSTPTFAALSPDGRWLVVAAGDTVHVINARDAVDSINFSIPLAQNPSGLVITPNSKHVYVMSNESSLVRILELSPAVQLLTLTVPLPGGALPMAIGMAPNGSRLYLTTPGQLYDVDRLSNSPTTAISNPFTTGNAIAFDPDPAVTTAVLNAVGNAPIVNLAGRSIGVNPFTTSGLNISKIILPGANRAYFLAGSPGRLFQGLLTSGGPVTEVSLPEFGISAVDVENSPDGRWIFVAFGNRLSRFDPSGAAPASQSATQQPATGMSLVYAASVTAAQVQVYGGNLQNGPSGTGLPAPLAVRVRGANNQPTYNQIVTFNSTNATIPEPSVTTNLAGVAETFVSPNVSTPVEVNASVISGTFTSSVTFSLNGAGTTPGQADGLRKVSGDRQTVIQGSPFPFPLVVRATNAGIPVPGITLFWIGGGSASCPASALTDPNGEARFECSALPAVSPSTAEIQFIDSGGRMLPEAFRIQIVVSAADLPTSLDLESDAVLEGTVRERRPGALRFFARRADGQPAGEIGISLTAPGFDITFDPRIPVTGSNGLAQASVIFGCQAGTGQIRAEALTQNRITRNINFTIRPGAATQMIKRQGDNQSGNPGQLLAGPRQALLARLADTCGNGIPGQRVEWRVNPPEAGTLENVFFTTNDSGEASVLVRLGNRGGPFTVTATAGGFTATFNLSVNLVVSRVVQVSGNNQSVVLGQTAAQQLVVETQDANGFPVAGVEVSFRVTGGSGTLDPTRVTTNTQGRAATTLRAGSTLGTSSVVAEAVGQSVTFIFTTVGRVPVATTAGFVNGASFRPGWVPGSLGSIFGSALMDGVEGVVAADRAPFPTTLRGIRVTVEGVDAPLISLVSLPGRDQQINLQVPFGIPATGTVTAVIENNGSRATITGVPVRPAMPGIFEFESAGVRYAAALHADFNVVTPQNPARPDEIILLFLTGLGLTNPPVATNVAGPTSPLAATVRQPVVGLNGEGMEVLGSFYAPQLYTAYQINFRVGRNVRSGTASLSVVVDGVASQDARLPVQ